MASLRNGFLAAVAVASACASAPRQDAPPAFASARPVWLEGREGEKNLFAGFRAVVEPPAGKAVLRVAASTLYRAWVNGRFAGHGPARGPHGHYRLDEWDLSALLRPGRNVVAIEVAGYNANSYYLLDQPSFLQAEVAAGGKVLASTGGGGTRFEAAALPERVQKIQRYSFQRPFAEAYRQAPGHDRWRSDPAAAWTASPCAVQPEKKLIPRRIPYPKFQVLPAARLVRGGRVERTGPPAKPWKDRSLTNIGPKLGGYPEKDLESVPSMELQSLKSIPGPLEDRPLAAGEELALAAETYRILDLGANRTGFLRARVSCAKPVRLYLAFDEILARDDVDFKRLGCVNAVTYDLQPGTHDLESFEPYTLRYLKAIALGGDCSLKDPALREYANDDAGGARFSASDERLNAIFAAARETFRQNAVDVFMDCPSRERAGWLCDSFFTSRAAAAFNGHALIEKCFLENFLLPERFEHLPEGMLPMCYPADHHDGVFIPNWALWFVVQLEEYLDRSGDRELVGALKPRVLRLFEFFGKHRNGDGLLEKLPSWVFVEWSAANRFVQDVNYPSNMLYAGALDAAGRMYGLPERSAEAARVRETIRRQSFDGTFFVDNAQRKDGKLQVTRNRTEVCQYFAFFFGVATPETHAELWRTLVEGFGPRRRETRAFPEVHPANAFVGNMLRLELLSRRGRGQQILDESILYLLYMAERTGTLWENVDPSASCNHGFASHAAVTLFRDVLGLARVDWTGKTVHLRFGDLRLDRCEGAVPTPDGPVSLAWRREGDRIVYALKMPAGYRATVENLSGRELAPQK